MSEEKSPWSSINDVLIQNKCWLCNNTFPRGKTRKVFQVSDLLTFYHNHQLRLQLPDQLDEESPADESVKEDDGSSPPTSTSTPVPTPEESSETDTSLVKSTDYTFISANLQSCYDSYIALMNAGDGKPDHLFAEFKKNGVEVWMSGLVCGMNPECKLELAYFIEKKHAGNGVGKKVNLMFALPSGTTCPPGCGCDNPWPFMP